MARLGQHFYNLARGAQGIYRENRQPAVKREADEEWGRYNMDRWVPELFLISLLAAFCGGLAWIYDHELFAAAFAAAAVVAASQARPR